MSFKKCLNVRQKLGTRKTFKALKLSHSHSLSVDMLNNFYFHVYAHSLTLTIFHFHYFHYFKTFTLSFTLCRHAEQLLFSCLCSKVTVYGRKLQCFFLTSTSTSSREFGVHGAGSQLKMSERQTKAGNLQNLQTSKLCSKSLSHSLTLSRSHTHTLSISHSITLDMLNKFCFHLYAQKSLFIAEKCNGFF